VVAAVARKRMVERKNILMVIEGMEEAAKGEREGRREKAREG
jgi:hypothetical protein